MQHSVKQLCHLHRQTMRPERNHTNMSVTIKMVCCRIPPGPPHLFALMNRDYFIDISSKRINVKWNQRLIFYILWLTIVIMCAGHFCYSTKLSSTDSLARSFVSVEEFCATCKSELLGTNTDSLSSPNSSSTNSYESPAICMLARGYLARSFVCMIVCLFLRKDATTPKSMRRYFYVL